ncbi:Hypothetical protein EAG7_02118 [Klebsiella aerogenes]|nr:Hypothetical protein EAG7_02118 [Klebsiella aerogenes]CCG30592.1 hypothetical protein [Klebsiella aerogenes EA1509E]
MLLWPILGYITKRKSISYCMKIKCFNINQNLNISVKQ